MKPALTMRWRYTLPLEGRTFMRTAVRMCSIAAVTVLVVITTTRASAQTANIKTEVLKDWTGMKETMVKIGNEMPENKFTYKSTPPQRNYGEQILHVAEVNVEFLRLVNGKATAPTINMKATSKAAIVKQMADSFDYGTALINEQTPQSILETVNASFMGQSSRSRIFSFLIGHTWDVYGQMVVYLRLNGGVPPASQRP